jgi:PIN domain nuclease of toxin-antitoxin system
MKVVLDASAVLALILREPGADRVQADIDAAAASTVNMAEVFARCQDRGLDPARIGDICIDMGLETLPFTAAHALMAGQLRISTRALGLSLGDRACLATAMLAKKPVLTADRAWLQLDLGLEIVAIR